MASSFREWVIDQLTGLMRTENFAQVDLPLLPFRAHPLWNAKLGEPEHSLASRTQATARSFGFSFAGETLARPESPFDMSQNLTVWERVNHLFPIVKSHGTPPSEVE